MLPFYKSSKNNFCDIQNFILKKITFLVIFVFYEISGNILIFKNKFNPHPFSPHKKYFFFKTKKTIHFLNLRIGYYCFNFYYIYRKFSNLTFVQCCHFTKVQKQLSMQKKFFSQKKIIHKIIFAICEVSRNNLIFENKVTPPPPSKNIGFFKNKLERKKIHIFYSRILPF